jgi:hypothetical protein
MLPVGSRSYSSKVDAIVFEGKSINHRLWGGKYGDLASPSMRLRSTPTGTQMLDNMHRLVAIVSIRPNPSYDDGSAFVYLLHSTHLPVAFCDIF